MEVLLGFGSKLAPKKMCKLKKALYTLKQSLRAWFGRFAKVMKKMVNKQSQGDHTLFIKHSNSGGVTSLLIYVDDIIITGNNENERQTLRQCLSKEFEVKELERLKYFLQIEVAHSKKGIFFFSIEIYNKPSQGNKLACKIASTPIHPNHKLREVEKDFAVDRELYQSLVGKFILHKTKYSICCECN